MKKGTTKPCRVCGGPIIRNKEADAEWERRARCSRQCMRAEAINRVIAGDSRISSGYRKLFCPMHPAAQKGEVYEHRVIVERHLERLLAPNEVVHHRNGNTLDNRIENLEVLSHHDHRVEHGSGLTNDQIRALIRIGLSSRQITALGVSTHRIVDARQEIPRDEARQLATLARLQSRALAEREPQDRETTTLRSSPAPGHGVWGTPDAVSHGSPGTGSAEAGSRSASVPYNQFPDGY